jgi:transposase
MPPKKRVDLPDHVRGAVLADVALTHEQALEADERDKIRMYLALEQGVTTDEIAEELKARGMEISQPTVSRYARAGKEIYVRREQARNQPAGEDPVRSSQREPVG